jgi:ABC-type multidrug transport system fused ATPase/permease subunit
MHKYKKLSSENTKICILLVIGLFENLSEMSYFIPEFTHRYGVLKSNEIFLKDLVEDIEDTVKNEFHTLLNSTIEFKDISFKYDKTNKYLLQNFSIILPENKIICIYGQSGVGKTTFIKLIFGVESNIKGEILIGGKNIKDYKLRDMRKYISYIDQNTSNLFNRSVLENIIYGKEYTEEEKNNTIERIKDVFTRFNLYSIFKNLDSDKNKWDFLLQNVGK